MSDATNVKLGVCEVTFNDIALGHTKGPVEVTYEPVWQDITVDKYGESTVDKILVGEKLMAKVPLAEFTIANLKKAMPAGQLAGAADKRLQLGRDAGLKASDNAYELLLHPQSEGTRVNDIVFHKAMVASTVVLNHSNDGQKIIEVTFEALIDESKSSGNYLGLIGDST